MDGHKLETASGDLSRVQERLAAFRGAAANPYSSNTHGVFFGTITVNGLSAPIWAAITRLVEIGLEQNCQRAEAVVRDVIEAELR